MTKKPEQSKYTNLKAAEVRFGEEPPADSKQQGRGHFRLYLLIPFVLLIFGGLLVLPYLLPDFTSKAAQSTVDEQTVRLTGKISPYQKDLVARYRKSVQKIVTQLTDIQLELEKFRVDLWAKEAFLLARSQAEAGDSLFQAGRYQESEQSYADALAKMQAILDSHSTLVQSRIEAIEKSLAANDFAATRSGLLELTAISPANETAESLRVRLQNRPRVLEFLAAARILQENGQLTEALTSVNQAVTLDAAYEPARRLLGEIRSSQRAASFQNAMSRAFLALKKKAFDEAEAAFIEANGISPDERAQAGIQEVRQQRLLAQIGELSTQANLLEEKEEWAKAAAFHNRALLLKPDSVEIIQRLERSKSRAELDQRIKELLANPLKLSEPKTHSLALQILNLAGDLKPVGELLGSQLAALEKSLNLAVQPVRLRLTSDRMTRVHLYRVGRYKPFESMELELKPGQYTVSGTRRGYRDVQHTFTLEPGSSSFEIEVRCEERI